jgi:uncharacterized membrane protein
MIALKLKTFTRSWRRKIVDRRCRSKARRLIYEAVCHIEVADRMARITADGEITPSSMRSFDPYDNLKSQ